MLWKRSAVFVYGMACYLIFLGTLGYSVCFLGNVVVPVSLDSAPRVPVIQAMVIDGLLVALFAAQHSLMARKWFKQAWTRVIPPVVERSTYVLCASLALLAVYWFWEPVGGTVWSIQSPVARLVLRILSSAGWILLVLSTFLISHFDLFGVRQVWLYLRGLPYTSPHFQTPLFYRHVRHPLYLGWLLAFWATPVLTAARLLFGILTTGYLLIAIRFEEKDLIRIYGDTYRNYRARVPMILPLRGPKRVL